MLDWNLLQQYLWQSCPLLTVGELFQDDFSRCDFFASSYSCKPKNKQSLFKVGLQKVRCIFKISKINIPNHDCVVGRYTHLSTAVAWREKKFKHFVFYKYFSLVLGLLKSRISEKTIEPLLHKPDFKLFHYKARVQPVSKITTIVTRNRCQM